MSFCKTFCSPARLRCWVLKVDPARHRLKQLNELNYVPLVPIVFRMAQRQRSSILCQIEGDVIGDLCASTDGGDTGETWTLVSWLSSSFRI